MTPLRDSQDFKSRLLPGAIAGLIAGILLHLFNLVYGLATGVAASDAVFGGFAAADPTTKLIYALIIPAAWGAGFAYLVRTQPHVLRRPLVAGIVYGLVVYVVMQILLLSVGLYHRGGPAGFFRSILGYGGVFGPAVALITARIAR